jgi:NAD(P)-dependent dehydrogenase (short-subunit alcohol dehydrogenase family)
MLSGAAVRIMREEPGPGSIVLISSVLATVPSPRLFPTHSYAAAKGGALSLVKAAASYYARTESASTRSRPAWWTQRWPLPLPPDPDTVEYAGKKQPLAAGLLDPADIAAAAVFLLSDESRVVTGQVLAVDGGWSVTEVG